MSTNKYRHKCAIRYQLMKGNTVLGFRLPLRKCRQNKLQLTLQPGPALLGCILNFPFFRDGNRNPSTVFQCCQCVSSKYHTIWLLDKTEYGASGVKSPSQQNQGFALAFSGLTGGGSGAGDDMAASAAAAMSRSGNGDFAVRINGE